MSSKRDPAKWAEYMREYRLKRNEADPDYKANETARKLRWAKENPEKMSQAQKKYRASEKGQSKVKRMATSRRHRVRNPELRSAQRARYKLRHPEKVDEEAIKRSLTKNGLPRGAIPPDLIKARLALLAVKRITRQSHDTPRTELKKP